MKSVFVVLPFGIENYLDVATKLAFALSMKLGKYLKLLPENTTWGFGLYFEAMRENKVESAEVINLVKSIIWMDKADYILFTPGWEKYKECRVLYEIAMAYSLNIVELDDEQEVELRDCPFCGASILPEPLRDPKEEGGLYYLRCEVCGAQGARGRNEHEAMKLWDKREGG